MFNRFKVLKIVEDDADVEETTIQASDDTQAAIEVEYIPVEVEEEEVNEEQIFEIVEEGAEFPGGMAACLKWLGDHLESCLRSIRCK